MTEPIDITLGTLAVLVAVPLAVFTVEVLASRWNCRRRRHANRPEPRPRAAVLIPAHDEEAGIGDTLRSVLPAVRVDDRVLVVADNCTDATAAVARTLGAEVVERHDPERRGKGYALEFGVAHLADDPPEVLIVVDADCTITPESVDRLVSTVAVTGRPAQSLNLAEDEPDPTPLQAVSALSFRFKNLVRTRGAAAMGWPCHLMGTGMAVPWDVAAGRSFGGDALVEDMQLGVDLAIAGRPAIFEPDALVTSPLPRKDAAFVSQRTRWESGHVRTMVRNVPRLLWAAVRTRRLAPLGLALDLTVPPLSLLVLVWLVATFAAVTGWWWFGTAAWPMWTLLGAGAAMAGAILVGWWSHCRRQVPWTTFARVPWFVLRKVPIYVGMVFGRRTGWVRTERDTEVGGRKSEVRGGSR